MEGQQVAAIWHDGTREQCMRRMAGLTEYTLDVQFDQFTIKRISVSRVVAIEYQGMSFSTGRACEGIDIKLVDGFFIGFLGDGIEILKWIDYHEIVL